MCTEDLKQNNNIDKSILKQFKNPMSDAIHFILNNLKNLKVNRVADMFPAFFAYIAYGFALLICSVFWVYGWFSVLEQLFRYLISIYLKSIRESEQSKYIEDIPLFISVGVFTICWIPFFIIILPLYVIGFIVKHFINARWYIKLLILIFVSIFISLYILFDVKILLMRIFRVQ